ncbi:hypothetical protein [Streptomyces sp. NPDC047009]|uniref:telomere-protecting terminal protein Tpg n=1 Tax=Streptomyces sp. NPDC047009 TaxID=3154496 RepID=UPI0033D22634
MYTASVAEALDIADAHHWTRQPPLSDRARLRFLNAYHTDIHALAERLNTAPGTVRSILDRSQTTLDEPLRQAILREVIRLWQPRVRRRAHREIATDPHLGIWVQFRAWFGFNGAVGSSDDGRRRDLSQGLAHPFPARLFEARYRNAPEHELRQIVADAVGEAYFGVSPSGRLHMVRFTDIEYIAFSY